MCNDAVVVVVVFVFGIFSSSFCSTERSDNEKKWFSISETSGSSREISILGLDCVFFPHTKEMKGTSLVA